MAKKRKNNKKLRREVEILKAQLKSNHANVEKNFPNAIDRKQENVKNVNKDKKIYISQDPHLVRKDLLKTLVLSGISFAVILTLWALRV